MKELTLWFRGSATGKLAFIGLLVLVMSIPLGMIEHRIAERGQRADDAQREIASVWGATQVIGGPVLILPYEQTRLIDGDDVRVTDELYVLPSELNTTVSTETQILRRGIYEIPVYTATVEISGALTLPNADALADDATTHWEDAALSIPIGDARSIREPVSIAVGAASTEFAPAGERIPGLGGQLEVSLRALGIQSRDDPLRFAITLRIGGSGGIAFLPFGGVTRVDLQSDWPSPSFHGGFLPDTRSVDTNGFNASWRVLDLGRGYASSWLRSQHIAGRLAEQIQATSFGVDFVIPIGAHRASLRATKYAVLFLALTFIAYFLYELFTPLRLHTFQYLLVGAANTLFYLLLIALSEHIGFVPAYWASALASTALIGCYSVAMLGAARRALPIALMLVGIYGYLYFTLLLEDLAFLSGSLALFGILAAVMYLTRHIDWFKLTLASTEHSSAESDHGSSL